MRFRTQLEMWILEENVKRGLFRERKQEGKGGGEATERTDLGISSVNNICLPICVRTCACQGHQSVSGLEISGSIR